VIGDNLADVLGEKAKKNWVIGDADGVLTVVGDRAA
jgi:hypothetical protein